MRLENLLALTHGKLINEPFVKQFNNIVFEAKAVKRGDLFIAFHEEEIEDAIAHGAYGILFCKPAQISDFEIAWIKVDDLENALERILRFILIEKELKVYECNEITLKLALQVITEPNFIALHGEIRELYRVLHSVEHAATLLFCPSVTSRNLFTQVSPLSEHIGESINIIEQTLFETSFIYDNVFYERQLISPFFIPFLETLLNLFKQLKINYRLRKFTPIDHFQAVFTNKNFEIKEFGTSDKVLIFEKSSEYIEKEIAFLQKEATWAKTLYLIPQSCQLKEEFLEYTHLQKYKNENEILNILRENSFHFALIIGVDKSILATPLHQTNELTLFDFK